MYRTLRGYSARWCTASLDVSGAYGNVIPSPAFRIHQSNGVDYGGSNPTRRCTRNDDVRSARRVDASPRSWRLASMQPLQSRLSTCDRGTTASNNMRTTTESFHTIAYLEIPVERYKLSRREFSKLRHQQSIAESLNRPIHTMPSTQTAKQKAATETITILEEISVLLVSCSVRLASISFYLCDTQQVPLANLRPIQNTKLDRSTLSVCVAMIESGTNPEALAVRTASPPHLFPSVTAARSHQLRSTGQKVR